MLNPIAKLVEHVDGLSTTSTEAVGKPWNLEIAIEIASLVVGPGNVVVIVAGPNRRDRLISLYTLASRNLII